ncbi:hypothetical protein J2X34_000600 [Rhodococcus sp. BE178]
MFWLLVDLYHLGVQYVVSANSLRFVQLVGQPVRRWGALHAPRCAALSTTTAREYLRQQPSYAGLDPTSTEAAVFTLSPARPRASRIAVSLRAESVLSVAVVDTCLDANSRVDETDERRGNPDVRGAASVEAGCQAHDVEKDSSPDHDDWFSSAVDSEGIHRVDDLFDRFPVLDGFIGTHRNESSTDTVPGKPSAHPFTVRPIDGGVDQNETSFPRPERRRGAPVQELCVVRMEEVC